MHRKAPGCVNVLSWFWAVNEILGLQLQRRRIMSTYKVVKTGVVFFAAMMYVSIILYDDTCTTLLVKSWLQSCQRDSCSKVKTKTFNIFKLIRPRLYSRDEVHEYSWRQALLLQRGHRHAIVSVCSWLQQYKTERSRLLLVTSASDLPMRTIKFCYILFDVLIGWKNYVLSQRLLS